MCIWSALSSMPGVCLCMCVCIIHSEGTEGDTECVFAAHYQVCQVSLPLCVCIYMYICMIHREGTEGNTECVFGAHVCM